MKNITTLTLCQALTILMLVSPATSFAKETDNKSSALAKAPPTTSQECLQQVDKTQNKSLLVECAKLSAIERNKGQIAFYEGTSSRIEWLVYVSAAGIFFSFIGLCFAGYTRYLNRQTLKQSQHSNFNDRYIKAVEMLGLRKTKLPMKKWKARKKKLNQKHQIWKFD